MTGGDALISVLSQARDLGFLGPPPVSDHIEHAAKFSAAIDAVGGERLDLGSGGGVPGLVLATLHPDSRWALLEASRRRAAFLERATLELGLSDRVRVLLGRAEELGRDPTLRGAFGAVVARSFAQPSVTAECGAPFLRKGGILAVSEPPDPDGRWLAEGLRQLGLVANSTTGRIAVFRQSELCPAQFPRRTGVPEKRPLF